MCMRRGGEGRVRERAKDHLQRFEAELLQHFTFGSDLLATMLKQIRSEQGTQSSVHGGVPEHKNVLHARARTYTKIDPISDVLEVRVGAAVRHDDKSGSDRVLCIPEVDTRRV